MAPSIVYLNGKFLKLEEAHVPVLDRGFIFGDGVYEVIPVFGGKPFRLSPHIERLDGNLAAVRIKNPYTDEEWQELLATLISKNGSDDQSIYLQITRGVAKRDHGFPAQSTPTVFAMCNPISEPSTEVMKNGICAITLDDIRWQHCNIKAITLLPNILLRQQALDSDCDEAILIRNNKVTEGAASNIFIVKDSTLITPPKSEQLLPGITRDLVVELSKMNNITCLEQEISESELRSADEIWITSSTKEIVAVTTLDGTPVGSGKPGEMWKKIVAIYNDYKQQLRQK